MRFVRFVAKALLAILLLFDADLIWHIWKHGRPFTLILKQVSPDAISVTSRPIPITIWDWANLLILLVIHAVLISYLLWPRRKPGTPPSAQATG